MKSRCPRCSPFVCVYRGEGGVTKSKLCKLCGEDMVSTKAFVHFIKQPSSSLEQIKTLLFTASLRDNFTQAVNIHIRNKFHFFRGSSNYERNGSRTK